MVEDRLAEQRQRDPPDADLVAAAEARNTLHNCCGGVRCCGINEWCRGASCPCAGLCGGLTQRRVLKAAQHTLTIGVMPRFLQATLPELHRSTARALREDQMGLAELDGTVDSDTSGRSDEFTGRARAVSAAEMVHLF